MKESSYIFQADAESFQKSVLDRSVSKPILVDFYADWCSPCVMIAPVLHKFIESYQGELLLAKIDADENMRLCGHYRLRGFPTLILFQNGEEQGRFGGFKPAHEIEKFIHEHRLD